MTIEHVDCPEADIHNPKGFSTASNDTILTKNTSGTLTWEAKTALTGDLPHGMSYISASAANTIAVATEYEQVAGTWTNEEASDITWSTNHFIISTAGDYIVYLTGNFTAAAAQLVSIDINREATIANGNEQGFSAYSGQGQVGATLTLPIGAVFYLEDLVVGDKITPMITTDDGANVTVNSCQFIIEFRHT